MKRLFLSLLLCFSCSHTTKKTAAPPASAQEPIEDPFFGGDAKKKPPEEPVKKKLKSKETIADKNTEGDLPDNQEDVQEKGGSSGNARLFGALTAELVPRPGREVSLATNYSGRQVSLLDLSLSKNEALMIDRRTKARSRETLSDITILGGCSSNACTDGLFDQRSKKTLLKDQPSPAELLLSKNGWVERLLRVAR